MNFSQALEMMREGYSVKTADSDSTIRLDATSKGSIFLKSINGQEGAYLLTNDDILCRGYEAVPKGKMPEGVLSKVYKSRKAVKAVPMTYREFYGKPVEPTKNNPFSLEDGYIVEEINSYKDVNDVYWVDKVSFSLEFVDIFNDDVQKLRDSI